MRGPQSVFELCNENGSAGTVAKLQNPKSKLQKTKYGRARLLTSPNFFERDRRENIWGSSVDSNLWKKRFIVPMNEGKARREPRPTTITVWCTMALVGRRSRGAGATGTRFMVASPGTVAVL